MNLSSLFGSVETFAAQYGPTLLSVVENVLKVMPGTSSVINGVELAAKITTGLLAAAPPVISAYDEIKAAANGGPAPTQAQWDAWNAAADQAHSDLQAAVAAAQKAS